MSWEAASRTIAARVDRLVSALNAELTARGLPLIASDTLGNGGLAIYESPRASYASPCVEIMEVEGPVSNSSSSGVETVLTGWVALSFETTKPEEMEALRDGYLAALVRMFAGVEARQGFGDWVDVTYVTTAPARKQANEMFIGAVAVKVEHTFLETI